SGGGSGKRKQECPPSLRWRPSAPDHVLGDRRLGDLEPKLEQFTMAQPCRSHRGDRSLRGSNADLRASVCLSGSGPRTATAALVRGDAAPDRRVAGAAALGGVPVERGADRAYVQAFTRRLRTM